MLVAAAVSVAVVVRTGAAAGCGVCAVMLLLRHVVLAPFVMLFCLLSHMFVVNVSALVRVCKLGKEERSAFRTRAIDACTGIATSCF